MANQLGMVFSKLDCKPRWRERLSELAIPALVVCTVAAIRSFLSATKGARARDPDARLLVPNGPRRRSPMGRAGEVAAAMLAL